MKGLRPSDMAFRYGGEELAVLMPSSAKAQAAEAAEKLRVAVRDHAQRPGRFGDRLTVSLGVATFTEDGRTPARAGGRRRRRALRRQGARAATASPWPGPRPRENESAG